MSVCQSAQTYLGWTVGAVQILAALVQSSVREVTAVVGPELLTVLDPVCVRLSVFLELRQAAEVVLGRADGAGVEPGRPGEVDVGQGDQGSVVLLTWGR